MARPIKVLCASEDVKTELRRRAKGAAILAKINRARAALDDAKAVV